MEHSPELAKKGRFTGWMTLLIVLAILAVITMIPVGSGPKRITVAEGTDSLANHIVEEIVISSGTQTVSATLTKNHKRPKRHLPKEGLFGIKSDPIVGKEAVFIHVQPQVETATAAVAEADPQEGYDSIYPVSTWWESMLTLMIPMLLLLNLFFRFASRISGKISSLGFGESRARKFNKEGKTKAIFADMIGVNEAVEELQEIKEFLAKPDKFHKLGTKIPKDVLLYGSSDTGETLLAKVVAEEVGTPFFSMSGSKLVEMFVGMGVSQVWDLSEQARDAAPAIIFVDEIDAVGRHRGTDMRGCLLYTPPSS